MTSGADIAVAIGTIATATLAALGLVVSLSINQKGLDQADAQARADRQAAYDLAAADRAAIREDAERRHIVDLLLRLGRQVGRQQAYSGAPQSADAAQQIRLLLNALPAESAVTVRQKFNADRSMRMPGAVGEKLSHLHLGSAGGNADTAQMHLEIAYDIDRYLTSGRPPAEVWDSLEEQRMWQRERWPQR